MFEWFLFQLFAFALFFWGFYDKKFPLGKLAFALFCFFFFPGFNASALIGIKMFNVQNTLLFFGFIVLPGVIILSYTKFAKKTPVIILGILFVLSAVSLVI